jgi:hypothetical protein
MEEQQVLAALRLFFQEQKDQVTAQASAEVKKIEADEAQQWQQLPALVKQTEQRARQLHGKYPYETLDQLGEWISLIMSLECVKLRLDLIFDQNKKLWLKIALDRLRNP